MVEKLKQYPVTALTVVAMVLITLLLGDLAWFRKLSSTLKTLFEHRSLQLQKRLSLLKQSLCLRAFLISLGRNLA